MEAQLPQRRSIRLPDWDYASAGAYHVTIVAARRRCIFGEIIDGAMRLSPCGEIVREQWLASAEIRREIELDEFVVMPNHFHGLVWINGPPAAEFPVRGDGFVRPPRSLGALVAGYKSAVTRRIRELWHAPGAVVWQGNYFESIMRDERHLNHVRQYIIDNPARWAEDPENPARARAQSR